ncbi:MAG: nuclease-related domain-containing protein, partial [Steroidobacteraceae bacterium]
MIALTRVPPQPWLYTGLAVAASLYAAQKFAQLRARFRHLVLGQDGERVVTEELEKLRANGADVIHDVPAPGFNIDHVVLTRRGFYAIETKTWSKPRTGDARIHLTQTGIVANGYRPSRD